MQPQYLTLTTPKHRTPADQQNPDVIDLAADLQLSSSEESLWQHEEDQKESDDLQDHPENWSILSEWP